MNSWILGSMVSYGFSRMLASQTSLKINVKHAMPGRIRLECPKWKNEEVAVVIEKEMLKSPIIKECQVSPITGSLLLIFNKEYLSESEFDKVLQLATKATVKGFDEKEADALKLMKKTVRVVDRTIKSRSLGMVDLKSMIIIGLIVKSLSGMTRNPGEGGRQLLWAYRFLGGEGVKN